MKDLFTLIDEAWEVRTALSPESSGKARDAVETVLSLLDKGELRVSEKIGDEWITHQWIKKAVLLSFRLQPMTPIGGGALQWYDKVPLKCSDWKATQFNQAAFRAVPGAIVRRSAYVAPNAVLMPCFINVGARVGEGTMIDTWSTVGSCAQVGNHCHISGGVGIGGVLEPLQANPVIIEDNVFIGARSEVAEGVIVEEGAVIAMGVFLGASTKIVDRTSGEISYGRVPAYSVVVPGTLPGKPGEPQLACAVIVKRVDAKTREKTGVNELLRA